MIPDLAQAMSLAAFLRALADPAQPVSLSSAVPTPAVNLAPSHARDAASSPAGEQFEGAGATFGKVVG